MIAAAGVAARVGASLRVASFAVRPRPPYTAGVGPRAEAGRCVAGVGRTTIEAAAHAALEQVERAAAPCRTSSRR